MRRIWLAKHQLHGTAQWGRLTYSTTKDMVTPRWRRGEECNDCLVRTSDLTQDDARLPAPEKEAGHAMTSAKARAFSHNYSQTYSPFLRVSLSCRSRISNRQAKLTKHKVV